MCIGQAGEELVLFASIMARDRAAERKDDMLPERVLALREFGVPINMRMIM